MSEYRAGDVVNGHMLGSDGVWHPVAAPPAQAQQQVVLRLDRNSYWSRYLRRWFPTVGSITVVMYVLTLVFNAGLTGGESFGTSFVSFFCIGLPAGTVVNFGVAAFPNRVPKPAP